MSIVKLYSVAGNNVVRIYFKRNFTFVVTKRTTFTRCCTNETQRKHREPSQRTKSKSQSQFVYARHIECKRCTSFLHRKTVPFVLQSLILQSIVLSIFFRNFQLSIIYNLLKDRTIKSYSKCRQIV